MSHPRTGVAVLGALLLAHASAPTASAQYAPYYPPAYGGYSNFGPGATLAGQADVINATGNLQLQQEQARITREQATQAKLDTKKKSVELMLWEKEVIPTFSQEQEKIDAQILRRVLRSPTEQEVITGKACNIILPYLQNLTNRGIQGPPVSLDPQVVKQLNVTVGTAESGLGMLKRGGTVDWPLVVRGPAQKKLAGQIQQAVSATITDSLDPKQFRELTGGVKAVQEELRKKFHKEEIDGGEYLEGKRFLDKLEGSVKMLSNANAAKFLDGSYSARGRTVQELVQNMTQQGIKFAPCTPGGEPAYYSLHSSFVAYSAGAENNSAFRVQTSQTAVPAPPGRKK